MTFALLAGIVATSIVGSIHCVAMCGPLVGMHGGARTLRLAFTHAAGRLTTYVLLGAFAGAVGSAIDLAGRMASVQRAAMLVAGIVILVPFVISLVRRPRPRGDSTFGRALVQIHTRRPARRAWVMGALTGLLPCGWLWAFVVSAGATGGIATGAGVMAAFWLGTVPAMVGLLAFAEPVVARLRARMPVITGVVIVALGLSVLALRWHDAGSVHCLMCYGASL